MTDEARMGHSGVRSLPWWVEYLPAWMQPIVALDLCHSTPPKPLVGADDEHTPRGRA